MGTEFHAYGTSSWTGRGRRRDPRNGRSPETEGTLLDGTHERRGGARHSEAARHRHGQHLNGVNQQVDRHNVNHTMTQRHLGQRLQFPPGHPGRRRPVGDERLQQGQRREVRRKRRPAERHLEGPLGIPVLCGLRLGFGWDASKVLKAGCDLEMDVDVSSFEEQLTADYVNGIINDADLDRRFGASCGQVPVGHDGQPAAGQSDHRGQHAEHQALCLDAGREAIVLLKNEADILPLSTTQTVAMVGPSAAVAQLDGFGRAGWIRRTPSPRCRAC